YDAAAAGGAHVGDGGAGEFEGPAGVGGQHGVPVVVFELPQHSVAQDASIVDEHIDRPGFGNDLFDRRVDLFGVGDIGLDGLDPGVLAGFLKCLFVKIDDIHIRAPALEGSSD